MTLYPFAVRKASNMILLYIFFSLGCDTTLWKNEKFTLTEIFFRQINSLVIYLVNALLSRNFCQKSVRVNFCNYNTVVAEMMEFYSHDFWQKLREINMLGNCVFTKK